MLHGNETTPVWLFRLTPNRSSQCEDKEKVFILLEQPVLVLSLIKSIKNHKVAKCTLERCTKEF